MDMGELIRKLRIKHDLTQEELGSMLGLKKAAIHKYESGKIENIKRSTIQKMADIFNVSPAYLMGWDEPKKVTTVESNKNAKLSKKEEHLLEHFNELNETGKDKIINYTKDLKEIPRYQKESFINKEPKKIKHIWEEPGKEYLMPIASHDDDLTDEERENMDKIALEMYKKLRG